MAKTFEDRVSDLLNRTRFPDLKISAHFEMTFSGAMRDARWYLRVDALPGSHWATCAVTQEALPWSGRKWRLSEHMTDGEVVQTAFLAVKTALEHEARERFTFDGVSVFDPHYDIHKLVDLRRQDDSLEERR